MFCCPSLIGGLVLLIVFLVFLAQSKKSRRLKNSVSALRDKANSWDDTEITDFDPRTKIREEDFNDMTDRLKKRIVVPNLVEPEKSPYGTPATYVDLVADHLTESFDFSMVNDVLCQFKHFKTVIGDINLHFIHMVGSEEKKSTPIILLHGWPSTVWEFHKSIPILVEQGYTIVAPSLPGHGFTDPPTVSGVTPAVIACAYHKLMLKLGYNRFIVHGGDWGAIVGDLLTYIYPESVIGLHVTFNLSRFGWRAALQMMVGAVLPSLVYSNKEEENSVHPLSKAGEKFYREFAYFHVQSVMPDSYGYGMVDSPVGLLGWIGSAYARVASSLKDDTENLMAILRDGIKNFGIDNICANVSIFWCMRSAQASMRLYYEAYWNDFEMMNSFTIPDVPVAISNFAYEITHVTKFVSKTTFNNIIQFNYHDHGGHFSHIDNTEGVVGDLTSFIQKIQ